MGIKSKLLKRWGYEKKVPTLQFKDPFKALSCLSHSSKPVIFDVGAHEGETTLQFRKWFPSSSIFSFEPFPEAFAKLSLRFCDDPYVKPFQMALSDESGSRSFYVNKFHPTNSLLPAASHPSKWTSLSEMESVKVIDVSVDRVDSFCKEAMIPKIDILKIDAQGSDLAILKGADSLLKGMKIEFLLVEVLFIALYEGQHYFHEVNQFLASYGYHLFDLFTLAHANDGQLMWADGLFRRISHSY